MRTPFWLSSMFLFGCATTGSTGAKGTSAPFPGEQQVEKRRNELLDASKLVKDCLKAKAGESLGNGGVFEVIADASGKLSVKAIKWDGPQTAPQCVVETGQKATVTPFAGTPVGVLWEFWVNPPAKQDPPKDADMKTQTVQNNMANEVDACYQRNLPPDFPADITVTFYVGADGGVYAPTVIESNSKDGGYDSCVRDAVANAKFPKLEIQNPVPLKLSWHRGKAE
jgi:hypothetical protein